MDIFLQHYSIIILALLFYNRTNMIIKKSKDKERIGMLVDKSKALTSLHCGNSVHDMWKRSKVTDHTDKGRVGLSKNNKTLKWERM